MGVMIVDCNNIGHIARHAMPKDLSHNEKPTAILYGFFSSILHLHQFYLTDGFIFCWDSRKSYRKLDFKPYKKRDPMTDEERRDLEIAYRQFKLLRTEILPELGIKNSFMKVGYEADDLMAAITKKYNEQTFTIVSTDKDLYQLLTPQVLVANPITKKAYTARSFENEYGIKPKQWIDVKAIAGCTSDKVPGINGVGEITAIKYLNDVLPKDQKKYREIVKNKAIIKRNKPLVTLPYRDIDIELVKQPQLKKKRFRRTFKELGFESFLHKNKGKTRLNSGWIYAFDLK